ncbi:MAG: alpha-1,2-fucosyltransferase [Opitutales bacterium]
MDDCIIVRIMGGLGNQMFQYAFGRYIADKLKVPLKLDLSTFDEPYEKRPYALDCFNIKASVASRAEVSEFRRKPNAFTKLFRKCSGVSRGWVREKAEHRFCERMEYVAAPAYLDGYWQCFEYMKRAKHLIEEDFQLRCPLNSESSAILSDMAESTSVSIHVRRGDYVSNPEFKAVHGVCLLEYYAKAVDLLRDRFGVLNCYVFSDDPDWVREHLDLPVGSTIIDPNEKHPEKDLYLMMGCKHHVIANSYFSWWGAFLGEASEGDCVIAPKQWYANGKTSGDLLPEEWVRL